MANDNSRVTIPTGGATPHTIQNPVQPQPWGDNNYEITNTNQRGSTSATARGGTPNIGDLGRNYNFGNTYTNLSFQRDPFIHLLTKFKKKPTDDFKYEYAIKRNLATFKRYGYVMGIDASDQSALTLVDQSKASSGSTWDSAA